MGIIKTLKLSESALISKFPSYLKNNIKNNFIKIIILSFLIKIILVIIFSNITPVDDPVWYYQQAKNISSFKGIISPDGTLTAFWPIGYSLILSLIFIFFGSKIIVGQLFNAFLSILSTIIFYKVCSIIIKRNTVVVACTILFTFYPDYLAYICLISPEISFIFFLLLALFFFLKINNYLIAILSGLSFGLATLVHPQAILIPFILFFSRHSFKNNAHKFRIYSCLIISLIIVILPILLRNYYVFNKVIFISNNGGVNLFIGNNPHANGRYLPEWKEYLSEYTGIDKRNLDKLGEVGTDSLTRKEAIDYIMSNPIKILSLIPHKIKRLFIYVSGVSSIARGAGTRYKWQVILKYIALGFENLYYYCLLFLWLISIFFIALKYRNALKYQNKLPAIIIIYLISIYGIIFFGAPKYNLTLIPFIILLLGQHYTSIKELKENKNNKIIMQ